MLCENKLHYGLLVLTPFAMRPSTSQPASRRSIAEKTIRPTTTTATTYKNVKKKKVLSSLYSLVELQLVVILRRSLMVDVPLIRVWVLGKDVNRPKENKRSTKYSRGVVYHTADLKIE